MKLRIIDEQHERFFLKNIFEKYSNSGIEFDYADNLGVFINQFRGKVYDGFLIHPARLQFREFMKGFNGSFPGAKFAIGTFDRGSSIARAEGDDGICAFDFGDIYGIKKYFERK
jgi:hypothetical protein